jgi:aminomethyltransferase
MIAVQGPNAKEKVYQALGEALRASAGALKPFHAAAVGELFIATTGYTGEDGFEIILPAKAAPFTWQMLNEAGVAPIGLGARDTLRLEAGMNLYGSDMDETTTPLESGLAWTVALEPSDRKFIGREVLDKQKSQGVPRQLVGLVLEGKGVLRNHQKVTCNGAGEGEITSGSFSPTLNQAIALARVPAAVKIGDRATVDLRGKPATVRVVKYPFVRNGKSCL